MGETKNEQTLAQQSYLLGSLICVTCFPVALTLFLLGYQLTLFWLRGGQKSLSPSLTLATLGLGRIRLWGKNFSKQQREWMKPSPLSNYDVISDFDPVGCPTKYVANLNFFVTSLFYSRLSSIFMERCKTRCSFLS